MAFFDADVYESLRRLVHEAPPATADSDDDPVADLHLNFTIQLKAEEVFVLPHLPTTPRFLRVYNSCCILMSLACS